MSDEARECRAVVARYVSAMDSCSVAVSSRCVLLCVLIVISFINLVFPEGTGCDPRECRVNVYGNGICVIY